MAQAVSCRFGSTQSQDSGTVDSLKSDEFACGFGEGIAFGSQRNLRSCERLAVLHPRFGSPSSPTERLKIGRVSR
jgi:hypothetical protein